ncbi:MAG: tetratricopeptide repeat protein [Lepagella sp.]
MRNLLVMLLAIIPLLMVAKPKESMMYTYNINRAYEEGSKGNYDEALEYFNKEIKDHPKNGFAYLGIAGVQFEKKHYDEVLDAVKKAIRLLPKKQNTLLSTAYLLRGQTMLETQDTVAAYSDMAKAISIDPTFADAYENRGQLFYEQHRYEESNSDYAQLVKVNPGSVMGYMGLGRNAQAQERYDYAISQYDKVIQMYPDYSLGYSFRAESNLSKKEYLKAIDDICKALEIDSDAKAYRLLFQFPSTQLNLVVTKLKGLSAKDPHTGEYLYYSAQLYNKFKEYDKAIDALKSAFEIDARPIILEEMSENYFAMGDFTNALDCIDRAMQMTPDDLDLISSKADILGECGDYEGAIAEWSKYIEKTPDFGGGYYRRGWFKDLSMKTDEALEDYNMAIMLLPDYAYAHLGKGDMLMRRGQKEEALESYRKVVELDTVPNNNSCAMYALLALGEKEKAIDFMNRVIENDSIDNGNYYDAACFYCRIGDLDKSLTNLRIALEKGFRRFHHIQADDLIELRKTDGFKLLMEEFDKPIAIATNESSSEEPVLGERTEIPFIPEGGCATIKCTINNLPLSFIFDTGASIVSLSQTEANFMLKNGYLSKKDMIGTGRFTDANGDVSEGTILNLREVDFGGLKLNNVRASVVRNQKASLLLGQTVLGRLGKIEIDNTNQKLIITQNR